MTRPTPLLAGFLAAATVVSLAIALITPAGAIAGLYFLLLIFLFALADVILNPLAKRVEVEIYPPKQIYIGQPEELKIFVTFKAAKKRPRTKVTVMLSERFVPLADPVFELEGTGVLIPLKATRRGIGEIPEIRVRWTGPFGLTFRETKKKYDFEIPIIPNTRLIEREGLMFSDRHSLTGLKPQRLQGEGSEFEAMMEFVQGLDPRSIDWKHSARHNAILCKQFEVERNHQVILAFDTGHLMSEQVDAVPKIDHAINAGLVLAFKSLQTGDKIGFVSFDANVKDYLAPTAGPQAMSLVRDRLARLDYSTAETNFTLGLTDLLSRLKRRSLIILFTDFVDSITAEIMMENVERLSRHHLVLFVTFRDKLLYELFEQEPGSIENVAQSFVARQFIDERTVLLKRLNRMGVQCLEAPSQALASQLIAQYLFIKNREMI